MTAHRPVRRHWLQVKQNASEGCNSCASLAGLVLSFIACFILLVIAPLLHTYDHRRRLIGGDRGKLWERCPQVAPAEILLSII